MIARPFIVTPEATAWSRASVTGRPELFVPSPETSMMRFSACATAMPASEASSVMMAAVVFITTGDLPVRGQHKLPRPAGGRATRRARLSAAQERPGGPAMPVAQERLTIETKPREIKEITREVAGWAARQGIARGLLTIFIPHTSASLLIQENYSPAVRQDLAAFLGRLAPEEPALYRHNDEGPDDMPAHLKSALTQVQLTIPVSEGEIRLGTWQGIFLLEHRAAPHRRDLILTLIGE